MDPPQDTLDNLRVQGPDQAERLRPGFDPGRRAYKADLRSKESSMTVRGSEHHCGRGLSALYR